MNFAIALSVAASWWGAQDVPNCHPVEVKARTSIAGAFAWTYPTSCRIFESPAMRNYQYIDPYEYCRTIVHEYGHLLGLEHPTTSVPGDIMNGDSRVMWPDVPACRPSGPLKGLYGTGLKGTE